MAAEAPETKFGQFDAETLLANPETRTPAQTADAAANRAGIGVPLPVVVADQLGQSPEQIKRVCDAACGTALDSAGSTSPP